MFRVALALLLSMPVVACSSSPTAPTPAPSLAGVWSGLLTRGGTPNTLRLDLQSTSFGTAAGASGRYEWLDAAGTAGGTVTGGLAGTQATLTLTPSAPPPCPGASTPSAGQIALRLTLDGTRLTGEAVFTLCGAFDVGTVSLTRQ